MSAGTEVERDDVRVTSDSARGRRSNIAEATPPCNAVESSLSRFAGESVVASMAPESWDWRWRGAKEKHERTAATNPLNAARFAAGSAIATETSHSAEPTPSATGTGDLVNGRKIDGGARVNDQVVPNQ
jgi:hypothetical protein